MLRKPSFGQMEALINVDHPTWVADLFHGYDKDNVYTAYLKSYGYTIDELWDKWIGLYGNL